MSQAKVDKYKEEKKNRAKIMKRQKIKKVIAVLVASLGIGALIGVPLGRYIYKLQKEKAERNKTISSIEYDDWFDGLWDKTYAAKFQNNSEDILNQLASDTDASDTDAEGEADVEELDDSDIEVDDGSTIDLDEETEFEDDGEDGIVQEDEE